ncbi:MAG: P22 phage major capsid protein family protein [Candidatus Hydrothermia bacterium]
MALDNFIPEIWSARLLKHLDEDLVFKQLVNTDYEGEIRNVGDTVRVNRIGDIVVGSYTKDGEIGSPQQLSGEQLVLTIDQFKYFNFYVDDVDSAQQNPKTMDDAMSRAAFALAKEVDKYIAGLYTHAGVKLDNSGAGYQVGTSTGQKNPYDLVIDIVEQMDAHNIPGAGRWLVIPPWFHAMLLKSAEYKLAFQDYKSTGEIPTIAGIRILMSNNLPTQKISNVAFSVLLAGTNMAISFAQQLNKVEAYRPEKRFADAVKGLLLFGAKVFYPESLVSIVAKKA